MAGQGASRCRPHRNGTDSQARGFTGLAPSLSWRRPSPGVLDAEERCRRGVGARRHVCRAGADRQVPRLPRRRLRPPALALWADPGRGRARPPDDQEDLPRLREDNAVGRGALHRLCRNRPRRGDRRDRADLRRGRARLRRAQRQPARYRRRGQGERLRLQRLRRLVQLPPRFHRPRPRPRHRDGGGDRRRQCRRRCRPGARQDAQGDVGHRPPRLRGGRHRGLADRGHLHVRPARTCRGGVHQCRAARDGPARQRAAPSSISTSSRRRSSRRR